MPDLLRSLGLYVYAFLDADSDEAKAFTTYRGYSVASADHIHQLYGKWEMHLQANSRDS